MDEMINNRRNEWKQRSIDKIKKSKNFDGAVKDIIDEYLYYSSGKRELYGRIKQVLRRMEHQTSNIRITRKKEFDWKWLHTICDILEKARQGLRQSRKKI